MFDKIDRKILSELQENCRQSVADIAEKVGLSPSAAEVLECHLMTGDADYLIKVAAPSTTDYERIYRRTIAALPHVNRIKSSLVMKTVKRWYGYPPNPA